ncbi:MAG: tetratricopeptide repeat protein, partial [Coriobacteriia bacterium]|nr:tetratricopeptide repeat protein [Coriobacteriia bacterium]
VPAEPSRSTTPVVKRLGLLAATRRGQGPVEHVVSGSGARHESGSSVEATEVIVESVSDPIERALQYAILGVIIVGLSGLAYLLFTGVISPPAPRTVLEAQLVAVREATKANPASGEVWADYITALVAVRDFGTAETVYKTASDALEGDQLLLVQIAGVEMRLAQERYEDAFEIAETAVALEGAEREKLLREQMEAGIHADPTLYGPEIATDVYLGHARTAALLEKWDTAVASLTKALEYSPRAADLYFLRGQAHLNLGDAEKAADDFAQAVRFDPEFTAARESLEELGEGE